MCVCVHASRKQNGSRGRYDEWDPVEPPPFMVDKRFVIPPSTGLGVKMIYKGNGAPHPPHTMLRMGDVHL